MDWERPADKAGVGMGPDYWRDVAGRNSLLRSRYPLDHVVTGRVVDSPARWGVAGIFVDLGGDPAVVGFVDLIDLAESVKDWPAIDTNSSFMVTDHVNGQVRMKPLDPAFRRSVPFRPPVSDAPWSALTARYPAGSVVTGTVHQIYWPTSNYWVDFGQDSANVDFGDAAPPAVGSVARYVVGPHLNGLRKLQLHPAPPSK